MTLETANAVSNVVLLNVILRTESVYWHSHVSEPGYHVYVEQAHAVHPALLAPTRLR